MDPAAIIGDLGLLHDDELTQYFHAAIAAADHVQLNRVHVEQFSRLNLMRGNHETQARRLTAAQSSASTLKETVASLTSTFTQAST